MEAQEKIMNYLNDVAKRDNVLASHLKNEKLKTPQKMMNYICGEAKKEADKCENKSSVCIDDDQVFQWARHYWLDYEEKEVIEKPVEAKVMTNTATTKTTSKEAKKEVVKKPKETYGQLSLFDDFDD